ncbi:cupin domain-containing protein [Thioalkalicoccus limnaeus]|uniref:Cupin domain-containing protein n=1 Tax=Thioalkalicoccus limnaeus TaxID=120681 RepID=A0ABV4BCT1_9GAMM
MTEYEILFERKPSPAKLEVLGVEGWPVWRKDVATFPWQYDRNETCYVLRGRFTVTPEGGAPLTFARGDLITFPAGLRCTWEILEPVEKHYRLD